MEKGIWLKISEKSTRGSRMLLNFKVKNVLSFFDLQEFSMVAGLTKRYNDRLYHLDNYSLLKFSAIYGANASGKSNFVNAIYIMKYIIKNSLPSFPEDYHYIFQDKDKAEPSYFEVNILIDNLTYSYGFEIDFIKNKLVSEWLLELNLNEEKTIFKRDILKKETIFGELFSPDTIKKLNFYLEDLNNNNNTLLLTFLNKDKPSLYDHQNALIFKQVYEWFTNTLDIADRDTIITSGNYFEVEKSLKQLSDFVSAFDTGISKITKIIKSLEEIKKEIPTDLIERIKENSIKRIDEIKADTNKSKAKIQIGNLIRYHKSFWILTIDDQKEMKVEKISLYHEKDEKYPIDLQNESDGTIRIIDLAEVILTNQNNKVYIIDGFNCFLHPHLTTKFVNLFLEKSKKTNNQLIVTTHESRLLDFDILRRDEIWFVDKKDGKSSLYSLDEFNVRFDKKVDKAYLEGRFGAVPIIDNFLINN